MTTQEQQERAAAALAVIADRKSVRRFQDKPVEDNKVEALLKAGMAAPTGKNLRPWEFYVITDREVMVSLMQPLPYAKMLVQTPLLLAVCGDPSVSPTWHLDCAAATQNILLAAEALGLGAVWVAACPYDDRMEGVSRVLNLPENHIPFCVIPIGYPDGEFHAMDKWDPGIIHRI